MKENEKFNITGMSCAACSARVERAVSAVPGVNDVSVNLLTNSMLVSYDETTSDANIIMAVEKAGYGASLAAAAVKKADYASIERAEREALEDHETPLILRRLILSIVLLVPLLYVSMGHTMLGLSIPTVMDGNPLIIGLYELLLSAAIMIVNHKFFVNGLRNVFSGGVNMDTLVALGSASGFIYSTGVLFSMMDSAMRADFAAVMAGGTDFYFETAGMILTLITVGKLLEARSKGRTTNALKGLMDLAPRTAHVLRDGKEEEIAAEDVVSGDTFVVRPGESFPADGVVLTGESAVNESAFTGESMPVDKSEGSTVSAATINQNGVLTCRATRVGGDTTLHQIIEMVQTAAGSKADISKIADRVSAVFVPAVIAAAALTGLVWYFAMGEGVSFALARAMSVLVISCPCALGLATPVAIMVGSGKGANNGILFKTAQSLEDMGRVDFVVLDKTGTLTKGKPEVTDIVTSDGISSDELLSLAAALENGSEHPLATAITKKAAEAQLPKESRKVKGFKAMPGYGVRAVIDGREAIGGNVTYMKEKGLLTDDMDSKAAALSEKGRTPMLFAYDGKLMGIIAVADRLKDDSMSAIAELSELGVQPVMLTGDNRRTAEAIGRELGLSAIVPDVLPGGKEAVIKKLQQYGRVAMVGDGINDAPALTRADVGVAIGAGSDIAIDAADVVLMKSGLSDVVGALRLSRQVIRNIHENLFWAFFYNVLGIPLAAGLWIPITGWVMEPMFGAAAMAMSSFCVVTNALRLNFFDVHKVKKSLRRNKKSLPDFLAVDHGSGVEKEQGMEEKEMKKTIDIDGMMCQHCVAHVTKALEGVEGVAKADVSLENNNAVVELANDVSDDVLTKAITDAGYEVKKIA